MPKVKIAIVLKRLLRERNLTAKRLAKEAGVPNSTLATWLVPGAKPKDPEQVAAVAQVLGITIFQLLFDEVENESAFSASQTEVVLDGYYRLRLERVITKKDEPQS